jgi:hypothetical protein
MFGPVVIRSADFLLREKYSRGTLLEFHDLLFPPIPSRTGHRINSFSDQIINAGVKIDFNLPVKLVGNRFLKD